MKVEKIEKETWFEKYAGAHQKIFTYGLDEAHIFDFVLGVFDDLGDVCGYITVTELDAESAFLSYGGMFMSHRSLGKAPEAFGHCLRFLHDKYKRAGFVTKTSNKAMINLGHKMGFEIIGMRKAHNVPCVEMLLEF